MEMRSRFLADTLGRLSFVGTASAHCDMPCGIYDPITAQIAAHTVIRMDMLLADAVQKQKSASSPSEVASLAHYVARATEIKEKHSEICKNELRVLWGDYFKAEHAQKYPQLHSLVFDAMHLASKARQGTDVKDADALLEAVNKIAEIFWETKGMKTLRAKASFYPTGRETVYPKLE